MASRIRSKFSAPCSKLRSFGSKCTVLKKVLVTLLGLFGAPILILGKLFLLCFPSLRPWSAYQGFPTCGTRTTSGTRRSSRWYAKNFHFFHKNLDSQLSSLRIGLCFKVNKCSCTPLYLLHRNMITFDTLLANLRNTSTDWCKVNKNKNLIKFSCGLFCCYFNVCYSSEMP